MIVHIKVKLHSNNPRLEKVAEGKYIAYLSEPADKGKANLQLIKMLSKEFFVRQDMIKIKTPTSREKIVEILL
jgi:uncharacterized protein YggU (UPF0235/DUF167 family)